MGGDLQVPNEESNNTRNDITTQISCPYRTVTYEQSLGYRERHLCMILFRDDVTVELFECFE